MLEVQEYDAAHITSSKKALCSLFIGLNSSRVTVDGTLTLVELKTKEAHLVWRYKST
jgi:hypothetical protein